MNDITHTVSKSAIELEIIMNLSEHTMECVWDIFEFNGVTTPQYLFDKIDIVFTSFCKILETSFSMIIPESTINQGIGLLNYLKKLTELEKSHYPQSEIIHDLKLNTEENGLNQLMQLVYGKDISKITTFTYDRENDREYKIPEELSMIAFGGYSPVYNIDDIFDALDKKIKMGILFKEENSEEIRLETLKFLIGPIEEFEYRFNNGEKNPSNCMPLSL